MTLPVGALFITLLTVCQAKSEKSSKLQVIPPHRASEIGNDVVFRCKYPTNTRNASSLDWILPGGISAKNISSYYQSNISLHISVNERVSMEEGKLVIRNISLEDSGVYTCINKDGSLSQNARLKVFLMPTYFEEGMVVIVLNGSLVVILLTCFVWTTYVTRKEYKRLSRRDIDIKV